MKRFIYLFSFILFISLSWEINVNAEIISSGKPYDYKNGLLDDEYIIEKNLGIELRDNDLETEFRITSDGSSQIKNYQTIIFKHPVNISGYYISYGSLSPNEERFITFIFDDNKSEIIYPKKGDGYFDLNYEGVIKIELKANPVNRYLSTKEIDFFGSYELPKIERINDISYQVNYNSVDFTWKLPNHPDFKETIIKKDGVEIARLNKNVSSYRIGSLEPETTYNYEFYGLYEVDGDEILSDVTNVSVTTDVMPKDTTSPSNVSNINSNVLSSVASLSWANPADSDFSHLIIYRNNQVIESNYTKDTLVDTNLVPNTSYTYKFVSVDFEGNESNGVVHTIKTEIEKDDVPPDPPYGLNVTGGSKYLSATWERNIEDDLAGYNIYLDGKKVNSTLVKSTFYLINGLKNDVSYTIQITAVDTSGNESELSAFVTGTPDKNSLPIFKSNYDLEDVSKGISSTFASIWLIIAFSVALPLSFYIGQNIKRIFLS